MSPALSRHTNFANKVSKLGNACSRKSVCREHCCEPCPGVSAGVCRQKKHFPPRHTHVSHRVSSGRDRQTVFASNVTDWCRHSIMFKRRSIPTRGQVKRAGNDQGARAIRIHEPLSTAQSSTGGVQTDRCRHGSTNVRSLRDRRTDCRRVDGDLYAAWCAHVD